MIVKLDFGHGGDDSGGTGNGLKEKDVVLAIGLETGWILKKHGVIVTYSRTTDVFVSLKERADKANKEKVDIFVSLHTNSFNNPSANGVETFSYPGSSSGLALSKAIQDSLVSDKLFATNRGTKTADFYVIRETNMPAALTELGFISNIADASVMRSKREQIAASVAKGILNYLGVKYIEGAPSGAASNPTTGFPIMSKTTATIEQMEEWAKKKGANQLFVDLAPLFYQISSGAGVNPLVTYTQSAKETGYMKFGGVLNASYKNPCGLKVEEGGGDKDPAAHKRFSSWEEGIRAQVDHLALYAGAVGYPKQNTPDPRHFSFIKGKATTVESLSGNWAPSPTYGSDIAKMIKEVESTVASMKPEIPNQASIKVNLLGKQYQVKGILRNGTNYVSVNGQEIILRDIFEAMGFEVSWDSVAGVVIK